MEPMRRCVGCSVGRHTQAVVMFCSIKCSRPKCLTLLLLPWPGRESGIEQILSLIKYHQIIFHFHHGTLPTLNTALTILMCYILVLIFYLYADTLVFIFKLCISCFL